MNKITLDGEIGYWGITAQYVKSQLKDMTGDVEVEFTSPGGSVYEGIEIANAFKNYNKGETTIIIGALGASMGSYIPQAFDKRKAYDNSTFMVHNPWSFAVGDHNSLDKQSKVLKGLTNILAKAYIDRTGKTEDEIRQMMDDETFLFGQEILDNGFVDEIIASGKNEDASNAVAYARLSVEECKASTKNHFNDDEVTKMVAILDKQNGGVNHSSFTASAQIKNSTQGNSMEYTEKTFQALKDTHAEAMKVVTDERDSMKASLDEVNAKLAKAESVVKEHETLKASVEAKEKAMPEIMAMAFDKGVDKKTLVAMAQADTLDKAKVALVDNMGSDGAFGASGESSSQSTSEEKETDIQARADKLGVTFIGE
jgi:ATP-dependent Clp protease protease subunit